MDTTASLDRLAELAGVQNSYWDVHGVLHQTTRDTKRNILAALGFQVETATAVAQSLARFEAGPWRRGLEPVQVLRTGGHEGLRLHPALPAVARKGRLRWWITLEQGRTLMGEAAVADLAVTGAIDLDGERFTRHEIEVWDPVPHGYHRLVVEAGGKRFESVLIVAPWTSWLPPSLSRGERRWGLSCHLYSLRSERDWGIGDFSGLGRFLEATSEMGGAFVGINPLHVLFPHRPETASPYSPSSRLFLNSLYIDIEAVPFFAHCANAQALMGRATFADRLRRAHNAPWVDYPEVASLKHEALAALFEDFRMLPAERRRGFEAFRAAGGDALRRFAVYQALHHHFGEISWRDWPLRFRRPDAPDTARFATRNWHQVDFAMFKQWLAEEQLAGAVAGAGGVGLYRDLAVGVDPAGADAWMDPDVIVGDGSFGAPPDAFNADGQDWGMPPLHPHRLTDRAYRPFVDMLRANMRHARALRIDHAMGLMRLYWIPRGAKPTEGAYLRYPMDDLMGVVALESHRNQCLVVGEDLGTVPDQFRDRMAQENILSYRVLYFERWTSGLYHRPDAYPRLALATATTHDLPTVAGHWNGRDLGLRKRLGLLAEDDEEIRVRDRELLIAALEDAGLAPRGLAAEGEAGDSLLGDLTLAVARFLARTPSALTMLNLDDLLLEEDQLNLPGTVDQYPNWRRRLGVTIEELAADPLVIRILRAVARERGMGTLD
ncbi:MAG: 4-alpha-glucanotransferase [Hyphomicrobiales bacterium]|nr:4-alpha-glucanotransferase [Hyphomicrobiales bacterium]MCP5371821.1 4-alpha-glucanotransferase [Hyphomicrobiales bacterium]